MASPPGREGAENASSSNLPLLHPPLSSLLPPPSPPPPLPSSAVAPTLVSGPVDTAQLTTTTVDLPCNVTGQPRPLVTWFKDGVTLVRSDGYLNASVAASAGGRLAVLEEGSLRIQQVQHSDQGSYSCAASNPNGTVASNTSFLTVLGEGRVGVGVGVGVWGECVSRAYCRVHLLQRCSGSTRDRCGLWGSVL